MPRLVAAAVALALCLLSPAARADDAMRCGDWLVSAGMSQPEVGARCGPPTRADEKEVCGGVRGRRTRMIVATWIYDRGSNEFVHTLVFHDGVLADIGTGGYGAP